MENLNTKLKNTIAEGVVYVYQLSVNVRGLPKNVRIALDDLHKRVRIMLNSKKGRQKVVGLLKDLSSKSKNKLVTYWCKEYIKNIALIEV